MTSTRRNMHMISIAALFLLMLAVPALLTAPGAETRGLTTPGLTRTGQADDSAEELALPISETRPGLGYTPPVPAETLNDSDWTLVDSDTFNVYLVAGKAMAIRFDAVGDSLEVVAPAETLTALAWQAVDYAPDWLGLELMDCFRRLTPAFQDTFATMILGAADPLV
ncbi:MAG: hypothetical protein PVF95_13650, partial [bacterium]